MSWLHHGRVDLEAILTVFAKFIAVRKLVALTGLLEPREILEVLIPLFLLKYFKLLYIKADLVYAAFVRRVFGVDALHTLIILNQRVLLLRLSIALPFVTDSLAFVHNNWCKQFFEKYLFVRKC